MHRRLPGWTPLVHRSNQSTARDKEGAGVVVRRYLSVDGFMDRLGDGVSFTIYCAPPWNSSRLDFTAPLQASRAIALYRTLTRAEDRVRMWRRDMQYGKVVEMGSRTFTPWLVKAI